MLARQLAAPGDLALLVLGSAGEGQGWRVDACRFKKVVQDEAGKVMKDLVCVQARLEEMEPSLCNSN